MRRVQTFSNCGIKQVARIERGEIRDDDAGRKTDPGFASAYALRASAANGDVGFSSKRTSVWCISCRRSANNGHSQVQQTERAPRGGPSVGVWYAFSRCMARGSTVQNYSAFADMERGGWSDAARASDYVDMFASASDQAIKSLLDAAELKPNLRSLDLCCGQGNVSAALLGRGCEVVGIDFSPAMLAFARQRAPKVTFIEADAQNIPFDEAEFDVVVSNFGICHVPDQPRALAEARRVLRSNGRFAMTVWCGPDTSPCFAAVYGAIKAHGDSNVFTPLGPDFHQFARPALATEVLSDAGFSNVAVTIVNCVWDLERPEDLFDIYAKATVRAAALLSSQPDENRAAIRSALASTVRREFAHENRWRVPIPAALVRATA